MTEVFALISKGGWLMIPIIVCSIVGLAIFLERLWHLQRNRILPARFLEVVSRLLQEGRFADAEALCHQNDSPVAAVLGAGIRYAGQDRDLIKEVMEESGRREIYFMERFTGALGSIATIAPLLGLLGTVIGMIRMFQRVVGAAQESQSMVDVGLLAEGIWQALMTTAAGLTVAIPVYLAYRYVLGRVDRYAIEIEDVGLRAVEMLVPQNQAPADRDEKRAEAIEEGEKTSEKGKKNGRDADKKKDEDGEDGNKNLAAAEASS